MTAVGKLHVMPKRTSPFQRMIAMLSAALGTGAKVTEPALVKDRVTGEEREVDVLIEGVVGGYPMTIGVEVNEKSKPASGTWVEAQRGRYQDLPIDKLVLVSRKGFYKPALVKAAAHRIDALTIEEALDNDWNAWAKRESTGIFSLLNINFTCSARVERTGSHELLSVPLDASLRIGPSRLSAGSIAAKLLNEAQSRDFLHGFMKGKLAADIHAEYTDPAGIFWVGDDGSETSLLALFIVMHLTLRETPVHWTAGRFRDAPFVAGGARDQSQRVEFTLSTTPDGSRKGFLLDESGLRMLTSTHTSSTGEIACSVPGSGPAGPEEG